MKDLQGRLVQICSHAYGDTHEVFRVAEVRPGIGFAKLVPEHCGDASIGFWVELDAIREALPRDTPFLPDVPEINPARQAEGRP